MRGAARSRAGRRATQATEHSGRRRRSSPPASPPLPQVQGLLVMPGLLSTPRPVPAAGRPRSRSRCRRARPARLPRRRLSGSAAGALAACSGSRERGSRSGSPAADRCRPPRHCPAWVALGHPSGHRRDGRPARRPGGRPARRHRGRSRSTRSRSLARRLARRYFRAEKRGYGYGRSRGKRWRRADMSARPARSIPRTSSS